MTAEVADAPIRAGLAGVVVYGVIRNDDREHPLTDVEGVEVVSSARVAAVVCEIEDGQLTDRRAEVRRYSTILDEVAAKEAVVPIRFGSIMPDRDSVVRDFLEPQEDYLVALLEELQGRTQFNLRARYDEDVVLAEVVAEQPEVADLRARTRDLPPNVGQAERVRLGELVARAMEHKRAQDSAVLLEALHPYVSGESIHPGNTLDHVLDASFLVDDALRDGFEDVLEVMAEELHGRVRLQLRGPLAPYDFVGG